MNGIGMVGSEQMEPLLSLCLAHLDPHKDLGTGTLHCYMKQLC